MSEPHVGLHGLVFKKWCAFCRQTYETTRRHAPDCGKPECQRKRINSTRKYRVRKSNGNS